jgi:hypothetical protein
MDNIITGARDKPILRGYGLTTSTPELLLNSLRRISWFAVSTNRTILSKKSCSVDIFCGKGAGVPHRKN